MCRTTEQTPRAAEKEDNSSGRPDEESSRAAAVEQGEVDTARAPDRGGTNETLSSSAIPEPDDNNNRRKMATKQGEQRPDLRGIYGYGRRGTNSDRFGDTLSLGGTVTRDSLSSLGSIKSRNGSSGPMTLTMASLRVREQLAEFLLALDDDDDDDDESSTCCASTGFGLSEGGGGGGLLPRRISRENLVADSGGSRPGRRFSGRRGSVGSEQRRGSVGSTSLIEASAIVMEGCEDISDDDDSVRADTTPAE